MKSILFLTCLFFISLSAYAQTTMCFNNSTLTAIPVGIDPSGIIHGDFNGDGELDLAVANRGSNTISVLIGNGSGNFATAVNYNTGNGPSTIQTADINNDGILDLVNVNYNSNNVSTLLGNGDGTFNAPQNFSVGSQPFGVICDDFNGDTKVDLAVTNEGSNNTFIFLGNGLGTFTNTFTLNGSAPRSLISKDFNGDGKKDLAIVNTGLPSVSMFLGNGAGGFIASASYTLGLQPGFLASADLNNDGKLDLAVSSNPKKINILLGNGNGSFTPVTPFAASDHSSNSLVACDMNNDGKTDLVNSNYSTMSLITGLGTGVFSSPLNYPSALGSRFTIADFNNDGVLDVAAGNKNSVILYFGNGTGLDSPNIYGGTDGSGSETFAACNLDADGSLDFVINNFAADSIVVVKSNSITNYSPSAKYKASNLQSPNQLNYSENIISADFNSDGKNDIALTGYNGNQYLVVKLGNGSGNFLSTNSYTLPFNIGSGTSASSDFNQDGNTDIVISDDSYGRVMVGLGNGNGTFSMQTYTVASGDALCEMITNDFNNDGHMDIAIGAYKLFPNLKSIRFLLGNGNGSFTISSFSVSSIPKHIVSADFNNDGKTDIAVSNGTLSSISIYNGLGTGAFSSPTVLNTGGTNISKLTIGDFDSDGDMDLVAANEDVNGISIFSNQGGTFLGATNYSVGHNIVDMICSDFDHDGLVDLAFLDRLANISIFSNRKAAINLKSQACVGSTAILKATKGGSAYSWSPNFSTSDTMQIFANGIYSVTMNYFNNSCSASSASINVTFLTPPVITVVASKSIVCFGSTNTLTANGGLAYNWINYSPTSTVVVSPTVNTTYTVIGTDTNNCSSTQTINILVDPTCADVWPGDANSDGVADNLDILELGLHYTQTGSSRAIVNSNWQSYFANNWTGTISNGKNLNHSDCNGDGIINDSDTLAIYNNYGLTHVFKTVQTTTVNPHLSIVPDQASVVKGTWGTSSIYLGDATTNITNLNGVAFTVDFDNTQIETNSIYIEYQNSFLDSGQNLDFRKLDFGNGKIYTATTHTVNNNVSGFGKIAALHYQIKSTLTADNVLNISLTQANQSNANGLVTPLTSGNATVTTLAVGIQELGNAGFISISPNPTNGLLTVHSKNELQKIEVVSITGQVLLTVMPVNSSYTLHLENFTNGIYFVNVWQNNRIAKREKIVLNR